MYEKAEGVVFCPTDRDRPLRVGGDYNGCLPITAEGAASYLDWGFNQHFRDRVEWFVPFLNQIVRGQDFSLQDLELDRRRVRLIHGRWPW